MIDIDNFKQINDQFGHMIGDEILKKLAELLGKNLRNSDILVRFGGEEFVALLPETNAHNAYIASEKLRTAIESTLSIPISSSDNNKKVTISIGVSNFPVDADSTKDLIQQADHRLYLAKSKGKNCTVTAQLE
jgi:diguanylate cyclase (GGDEF)-like protein